MKGEGREERHFRFFFFFFDHGGTRGAVEYLLEIASATFSFEFPHNTQAYTQNNTHKYTTSPPFHQPSNKNIHHTFIHLYTHHTHTHTQSIHPYKPISHYRLVTQTSSLITHIRIVATGVHTFKMGAVVSCVSPCSSLSQFLPSSSFHSREYTSKSRRLPASSKEQSTCHPCLTSITISSLEKRTDREKKR